VNYERKKKGVVFNETPCKLCPKKNIPNIFDCNMKKDYQILIIFGMNIPETSYRQVTI